MIKNDKKILILFCGGTIIMKEVEDDKGNTKLYAPSNQQESIQMLQNIIPDIPITEKDIEFIDSIDSTEIKPYHWDRMIDVISSKYDKYDGFVITHGTDSMSYTASALSIGLENLQKPVVLTGSQIPGSEINNDARRNLVNAMLLAENDIAGVFIVFDERIILGARSTKVSESKLDAYRTVNGDDFGEIKVQMEFKEALSKSYTNSLKVNKGFERDVLVYHVFPGCDPLDLIYLLNPLEYFRKKKDDLINQIEMLEDTTNSEKSKDKKIASCKKEKNRLEEIINLKKVSKIIEEKKFKGIVIRGYGAVNIPANFESFFQEAEKINFPVIVDTQCLNGKTSIGDYESGSWFIKYKCFINGHDQSIETLIVKLQHALAQKDTSLDYIKKIINKNFCGEIVSKRINLD